jgi:hypothetical protein
MWTRLRRSWLDEYGIDIDAFSRLTGRLLPLCASDVSHLTDTVRRGFVKDGAYIVKRYDLEIPDDLKISDLISPQN